MWGVLPAGAGAPRKRQPGVWSRCPGDRLANHYVDVSPGGSGRASKFWATSPLQPGDGKWRVCRVPSPGGDKRAKEEKAAAPTLSEPDPAASGPPTGPGREPKEERGGQAESTASGELWHRGPGRVSHPLAAARAPVPRAAGFLGEAPEPGRQGGRAAAPLELWLPRGTRGSHWGTCSSRIGGAGSLSLGVLGPHPGLSHSRGPPDVGSSSASRVPTPHPGAEQTEKADAPREPPRVEPKPDPTSSMAAAEAEAALSESSEQGTLPLAGPRSHVPQGPSLHPPLDPTVSPA